MPERNREKVFLTTAAMNKFCNVTKEMCAQCSVFHAIRACMISGLCNKGNHTSITSNIHKCKNDPVSCISQVLRTERLNNCHIIVVYTITIFPSVREKTHEL